MGVSYQDMEMARRNGVYLLISRPTPFGYRAVAIDRIYLRVIRRDNVVWVRSELKKNGIEIVKEFKEFNADA